MDADPYHGPNVKSRGEGQFDCRFNAMEPEELFEQYEAAGFLYPAKRDRLAPFWPQVLDAWRRSLHADEKLHYVVTYRSPDRASWASLSVWRTSLHGWHVQHLVSSGGGAGALAVLLTAIDAEQRRGAEASFQSWFRPANPFANALFGTIPRALGSEEAASQTFEYLALPLAIIDEPLGSWRLPECQSADAGPLAEIARRTRGSLYSRSEELDGEDVSLAAIDELYRSVGLRRYRRGWLAYDRDGTPVGAALAHRGPLGLNFSWLENRCDLLIRSEVAPSERVRLAAALTAAVREAYLDFPPAFVPIVTDGDTASVLRGSRAHSLQRYAQCLWGQSGLPGLYRHVESFYRRGGLAAHETGR